MLATALLAIGLGGCGEESGTGRRGADVAGSAAKRPNDGSEAEGREIEPARLARAALHEAGIPLYPGAEGLDATEFEKNKMPFLAVDFFTLDPPELVAAFYDRELQRVTARRDTLRERGAVRYDFEQALSGLTVKPWNPQGVDSTAVLARFDRRDALGVTTQDLDRYGKFLARARTHVIVNLLRPEPEQKKQ